jgi:hypothetical protein
MAITEAQVAAVAKELKGRLGGVINDYFGLLYLENEFKLTRENQPISSSSRCSV